MTISDNNFSLSNIPLEEGENTPEVKVSSGNLSSHSISSTGEENPQISTSGEKVIEHIGDESSKAHHLPSGISISTSGGEHAKNIAANIISFSNNSLNTKLPRNDSFSSISSSESEASETMSLSDISNIQKSSSTSSLDRSPSIKNRNSSSLGENISPLPKYDPTNKLSIQEFLNSPRVLSNMKEKGGHYIYVDEARSSFIFIPNGDFSKAKSIKVTNGKNKTNITNPKDLEMCIAKYAVIYNDAEADWSNRGAERIRQNLGLPPETPVNIKHFTLNLKYKQAVGYGEFNEKEASSGYTPSAWRRGSKIKVNKEVWDDVGGLNSVDLSKKDQPTENEDLLFSTETPEHSSKSDLPQLNPSSNQPVVININVAGGQGGQGGSSNTVINPQNQKEETTQVQDKNITIPQKSDRNEYDSDSGSTAPSETPEAVGGININREETQGSQNANNLEGINSNENNQIENQENLIPSNPEGVNNLLDKIRKHLNSVYSPDGIYVGNSRRQIRNIIHEHKTGIEENESFIEAPLGENINPSLISTEEYVSGNVTNQSFISNPNEKKNFSDSLSTLKANLNNTSNISRSDEIREVISKIENSSEQSPPRIPSLSLPEDQNDGSNLISAARNTSKALQNLLSSINFTSNQEKVLSPALPKVPPLSLPEDRNDGNNLVSAARNTSKALQNLLSSITTNNGNIPNIPSPENTESVELKKILKAVRKHVETVYSLGGRARVGGIAKVIKSEEEKTS